MKRILVTGAGGSPSTNFIRSLRQAPEKFYIAGTDSNKYYLMRSEVDVRYLVPPIKDKLFIKLINKIIEREKIEFIHVQNDSELKFFSNNRISIKAKLFLPNKKTVKVCQDKYSSYNAWKKIGIKVPETILINDLNDLKKAFDKFQGKVWLRATSGAGGKGSLSAKNYETAKNWISFNDGWGSFTAAELLSPHSVTWMSIWENGKLIVAQGRKRLYWELAKISPSGITGATGAGVTMSDKSLSEISRKAIFAIDEKPNGIFSVDLAYDNAGIPNPTEINIGRFFTTNLFFTKAGLNMPYIYIKLAYGEKLPRIISKINPLKTGLVWIRGMDFLPILTTEREIEENVKFLKDLMKTM